MKTQAIEKQSLLENAFEVLLENLGEEKTIQVWQALTAPKIDYLKIRQRLFAGKDVSEIYKEARKFNRK
ncbi:MAG: hypothetical protein ACREOW_11760 [Thermodesulfobacteriota bacterium]